MKELILLFSKLGFLSFGGPAAHIALMEDEVVRRRAWLTHEQFLDLIAATSIIPGPNSSEMAMHVGYLRAGWRGLIVSGLCFIIPAAMITLLFAHAYVKFGSRPDVQPFLLGIRPAVIAVILSAVLRLSRPIAANRFMLVTGICVALLSLYGIDEILLLFLAGTIGVLWNARAWLGTAVLSAGGLTPFFAMSAEVERQGAAVPAILSLSTLGLFFLKVGAILYGSGYVLVAFLQDGLVDTRHWLSQAELLDAISAGQVTPGPVLSTATFIGYLLLGVPGAAMATGAIFLPSFVFVAVLGPILPRLRSSRPIRGFLDGVTSASLGLMAAVAVMLGVSTLSTTTAWIILALALIGSLRFGLHAVWTLAGGALIGLLGSMQ